MKQENAAEEIEKFTTVNRREIVFYINQLINDGELISVSFGGGSETILTVLLAIVEEEDKLIFDWGSDDGANQRLLRSPRNVFTCTPHGVKHQFSVNAVSAASWNERKAFSTHLPDHFTRLQRREYYRLVLPMMRRPTCTLPADEEQNEEITLNLIDISIGGISLELPEHLIEMLQLKSGKTYDDVRIDLKSVGVVKVNIVVRDVVETVRGNKSSWRLGCEFVKLRPAMESHIQRFITDVQREARNLTS